MSILKLESDIITSISSSLI